MAIPRSIAGLRIPGKGANRARGLVRLIALLLLLVPVIMMARYGFGFLSGDVLHAPFHMIRQMAATQPFFSIHAVSAASALLTGWVQVFPPARRALPQWHRRLGYVYVAACLVGAVTALPVALHSVGGPLASTILIGQASLWAGLLWPALVTARRRRIADHRRWMIRHYALTCSAIVLRAIMATGVAIGYPLQLVLAIALSLAAAEAILRRPRPGLQRDRPIIQRPGSSHKAT
jgi:uncharacterized membrane protein